MWYTPFEDPNWWLVIVASLTGLFIGWQAWETRKSAESTAKQGALQREMLRPRLTISNILGDTYAEAANGRQVFIRVKISNSGGMPAYGVSVETWIEFLERDRTDSKLSFTANALHETGLVINVDTANPQALEIPLNKRLTDTERYKMSKALGTICFRIRLEYVAFGDKVYTDHAFEMQPGIAHHIADYTNAT